MEHKTTVIISEEFIEEATKLLALLRTACFRLHMFDKDVVPYLNDHETTVTISVLPDKNLIRHIRGDTVFSSIREVLVKEVEDVKARLDAKNISYTIPTWN